MKRSLTRWKWLLIPAIVILVITVALLTPSGPDKGVSVTFQHFISHPVNKRMALFVITNQRNHTVMFVVDPTCEVKSNGTWISPAQAGSYAPAQIVGDPWQWSGILEPRAWTTIAAMIPEGSRDWRAVVRSGRPPGKLGRLLFHSRVNLEAAYERRPFPGFKVAVPLMSLRTNYSREFTGEINTLEPSSSAEIPAPPR